MPGSNRVPRSAQVGDPFFPAVIAAYGAVSKGVQVVRGIQAARAARAASAITAVGRAAPLPASSFVGRELPITTLQRGLAGAGRRIITGAQTGAQMLPGVLPSGFFQRGVAAGRAFRGPGQRRPRRMNVCNVRALKRAIRRAKAFEKLARKIIKIPSRFKQRINVRGKR